jgi:flagellar motility protein MotE (MotC chaperone)
MAKRSLQVTGFARFFLVMLIVTPVAYVAASYYNGQDGIQKLKNILGIEKPIFKSKEEPKDAPLEDEIRNPVKQKSSDENLRTQNKALLEVIETQKTQIEELTRENEELQGKVNELQKSKGTTL